MKFLEKIQKRKMAEGGGKKSREKRSLCLKSTANIKQNNNQKEIYNLVYLFRLHENLKK